MTHSFLTRVSSDLHVICGTVLECDRAILGMDAVSHGKTCDEKRERARIVMKRAGRRKRGVSGPQIGGCGSDAGRRTTTVPASRSEEHTSELQSLMRTSYAVFCLKTKKSTERLGKEYAVIRRKQVQ